MPEKIYMFTWFLGRKVDCAMFNSERMWLDKQLIALMSITQQPSDLNVSAYYEYSYLILILEYIWILLYVPDVPWWVEFMECYSAAGRRGKVLEMALTRLFTKIKKYCCQNSLNLKFTSYDFGPDI